MSKKQEVVKSITYNGDELTSLQESLESYLGILTFNYMNWLIASTQGKQILPTIEDKEKKKQIEDEMKKIKDDLVVLDIAIPRVKTLLLKLNEVLGIDKTYDTAEEILKRNNITIDEGDRDGEDILSERITIDDETDTVEWAWEVQANTTDNEQQTEVSESA